MTLAGLSAALGKAESCRPNTIQRTQTLLTGARLTRPEKKHKHQIQQNKSKNRNKHTLTTNMIKHNATGVGRPSFSMHCKQHSRNKCQVHIGRLMDHWQIQEQRSDFRLLTQHVLPVILRTAPDPTVREHCPKPQPPAGVGCPGPRMSHQSRAGKNPTNMLSSIYLIPWVLSKQAAISWSTLAPSL